MTKLDDGAIANDLLADMKSGYGLVVKSLEVQTGDGRNSGCITGGVVGRRVEGGWRVLASRRRVAVGFSTHVEVSGGWAH